MKIKNYGNYDNFCRLSQESKFLRIMIISFLSLTSPTLIITSKQSRPLRMRNLKGLDDVRATRTVTGAEH